MAAKQLCDLQEMHLRNALVSPEFVAHCVGREEVRRAHRRCSEDPRHQSAGQATTVSRQHDPQRRASVSVKLPLIGTVGVSLWGQEAPQPGAESGNQTPPPSSFFGEGAREDMGLQLPPSHVWAATISVSGGGVVQFRESSAYIFFALATGLVDVKFSLVRLYGRDAARAARDGDSGSDGESGSSSEVIRTSKILELVAHPMFEDVMRVSPQASQAAPRYSCTTGIRVPYSSVDSLTSFGSGDGDGGRQFGASAVIAADRLMREGVWFAASSLDVDSVIDVSLVFAFADDYHALVSVAIPQFDRFAARSHSMPDSAGGSLGPPSLSAAPQAFECAAEKGVDAHASENPTTAAAVVPAGAAGMHSGAAVGEWLRGIPPAASLADNDITLPVDGAPRGGGARNEVSAPFTAGAACADRVEGESCGEALDLMRAADSDANGPLAVQERITAACVSASPASAAAVTAPMPPTPSSQAVSELQSVPTGGLRTPNAPPASPPRTDMLRGTAPPSSPPPAAGGGTANGAEEEGAAAGWPRPASQPRKRAAPATAATAAASSSARGAACRKRKRSAAAGSATLSDIINFIFDESATDMSPKMGLPQSRKGKGKGSVAIIAPPCERHAAATRISGSRRSNSAKRAHAPASPQSRSQVPCATAANPVDPEPHSPSPDPAATTSGAPPRVSCPRAAGAPCRHAAPVEVVPSPAAKHHASVDWEGEARELLRLFFASPRGSDRIPLEVAHNLSASFGAYLDAHCSHPLSRTRLEHITDV